jgi:hypothetical protein
MVEGSSASKIILAYVWSGRERAELKAAWNQPAPEKSVCSCACVQATSVRFQHVLKHALVSNQGFLHLGKQQVCSFRRSPFSQRNLRLCGTVQRVPDYGNSTSEFATTHGHESRHSVVGSKHIISLYMARISMLVRRSTAFCTFLAKP